MDTRGDRPAADTSPPAPDVRIEATNFGPLKQAAVALRPLTVFVGPSNTGKTYFAVLIYALYRVLGGFRRLPGPLQGEALRHALGGPATAEVPGRKELLDLLDKLDADGASYRLSDLSDRTREAVRALLLNPETLQAGLDGEFRRCFDLESVSDLVRSPGRQRKMGISLAVRERNQGLWGFDAAVSASGVTADGRLEDDLVLVSTGDPESFVRRLRLWSRRRSDPIKALFEERFFTALTRADAYYLPAARSGIMESHRAVASSLVARSTRGGQERFPELPTFSGVMADFMERLILYEEDESDERSMSELAGRLEQETLAGGIRIRRPTPGGYPEFIYRPQGTKQDVRLSRASSMVSELAPVVLFLRGAVRRGDTLLIEEPEAHLHPAAQTGMAVALARLVRAGVRVVVTTHSDWLLKEIGNLMRAGALQEAGGPADDDGPPSALRRDEVGIWLFSKDGPASGSTVKEIPFDAIEGVDPPDYEDVAEALYNRSADLQNQLEDAAKGRRS